jgi:ADP-ribose pyrophosphatase
MTFPRIINKNITRLSKWVSICEKEVGFEDTLKTEVYHSIVQADYVGIFAITTNGKIPIVRQFRPAVETFTWEFPAGMIDMGDSPIHAAERELKEETGLEIESIFQIGEYFPDTGRSSFRSFGFYATCSNNPVNTPEDGIEVRYVSLNELLLMIKSGEFKHQLHIALIMSALLNNYLDSQSFSI